MSFIFMFRQNNDTRHLKEVRRIYMHRHPCAIIQQRHVRMINISGICKKQLHRLQIKRKDSTTTAQLTCQAKML